MLVGAALIAALALVATPGVSAAAGTVSWSAPGTVPNVGTSATPAMTTCNGVTYMVWKGWGTDANMYYSWLDVDGSWAPQQLVGGGGGTSTGPAITCNPLDILMVAWKGVGNDEHMYYTSAPVGGFGIGNPPSGPLTWAAQQLASNDGVTDASPSLAGMLNDPYGLSYLAWHVPNSQAVEIATLTGVSGQWQTKQIVPQVVTVRSPTLTLGLTAPNGPLTLSLMFTRATTQANYYTNFLGGTSWSTVAPIAGGSNASPKATAGPVDNDTNDNLVVWQGSGNDTRIFYTVNLNQTGWQPQQLVTNGGPTTTGIAAADNYACIDDCYTQFQAYITWMNPQGQIEFVHGIY